MQDRKRHDMQDRLINLLSDILKTYVTEHKFDKGSQTKK
jgi:hypothetical protein